MTARMKSRKVETVAGNDEYVRLDIYEGRIPLADAGDRLLELQLLHHNRFCAEMSVMRADTLKAIKALTPKYEPWPVKWWRYFHEKIADQWQRMNEAKKR